MKLFVLLFGLLKLGKFGGSALTILISLAVYASMFGWPYAAGFLALLFIHEMGHYVAARQCGLAVGAPTFVPFVGAWIELRDQPMNADVEAYVAAAGPFAGSVASALVYFAAGQTHSALLYAIALSGFTLNLFNLIPLPPLDGGRITGVLSPRLWFFGAPLLLALMLYRPSPMLVVVLVLALPALLKAWKYDPAAPENAYYRAVPLKTRLEYGALYLGMAGYLAIMMDVVHSRLQGMIGR